MVTAYVVGAVLETEGALMVNRHVSRNSGRIWQEMAHAKRWLAEQEWVTFTGRPAAVYSVTLPGRWMACVRPDVDGVCRLAVTARVHRCEESPRARMLNDPMVVQAALDLAERYGKPYAVGRRAAVHMLAKFSPFSATDLAMALNNYVQMGVSDEDLRALGG